MGKTLHLVMLLALILLGGSSTLQAAEEDLTVTSTGFTSKVSKIEFAKNSGSTAPAWNSTNSEYRLYASGTLTITPKEGITITQIDYTFNKNKNKKGKVPTAKLSSTEGTFTVTDAGATWTGSTTKAVVLLAEGTAGNFGFKALKITYTDGSSSGKTKTTLAFADPADRTFALNATEGINFTNVATLTPAVEGAAITYASNNENIAIVDKNSGEVVVDTKAAGKATITASYAGDDTYAASSATYTITVEETLNLTGAGTEENPYTVGDALTIINKDRIADLGTGVYVKGTVKVTSENINSKYGSLKYTITDADATSNSIDVYGGLYVDSTKFTDISQVVAGDIVLVKGDLYNYENKTPEINKNNYIVKFYDRSATLDEAATTENVKAGHGITTVTLKRTFNNEAWNTLVLPFDVTAEQVAAEFGENAKVAAYSGATQNADNSYTLKFTEASSITANTPVFIYGAQAKAEGYTFTGVEVKDATPTQTSDAFNFVGTYVKTTVPVGNFFINANNKFFKAGDAQTNISGTRASFEPVGEATSAKALGFSISEGGETTAINSVAIEDASSKASAIYNLAGQRVNKAYKGVVVKDGKKYIQK